MTFEHVPPKAAYNKARVSYEDPRVALGIEPRGPDSQWFEQGGFGGYTLCRPCNNSTGRWYGTAYAKWAHAGVRVLRAAGGAPRLWHPIRIHPLRVIKQVMSMFLSINGPGYGQTKPDLRRFVLDRWTAGIPYGLRVFTFFNLVGRRHAYGLTGRLRSGHGLTLMSEVIHPPYGYLLLEEGTPPSEGLEEITFFGGYSYSDERDIHLKLPLLPAHSLLPADYRTEAQIEADITKQGTR